MTESYRTWNYQPQGNAYVLRSGMRDLLAPGARQVVVRVKAVSLNYRDLIHLKNSAGRDVAGKIPCSDGVGEVVSVGPDVTDWRSGDRVAANFFPTWQSGPFSMAYHKQDLGGNLDGMLAEYVTLEASALVAVPSELSDAEAACLPCAGVTAWNGLVTRGGLCAGKTVLVIGTGGVSIFALQIATACGAKVIVTSRSAEKLERAKSLGAWQTIHTQEFPEWQDEVWRLTDKQGVDHVVEVGGPGTLGKSMAALAPGGHLALIGVLTGFGPPQDSLFPLVSKNARLDGIYVGSTADFLAFNQFVTGHQLRPVVDRVYGFTEAPWAFSDLERGEHFGKLVIAMK